MRKLLLAMCLFASVGAMAQDTPKTDLTAKWKGTAGDKQPGLIIVDGKKYEGQLNDINADSIKSISVLKDKASTAIYGDSAKNGVILITTKKSESQKNLVIKHYAWADSTKEPLYIIDGVKADKIKIKALRPDDIKSISVLKNANATAIYGSQGVNGVILVTTKNALSADTTTIKLRENAPLSAEPVYIVDGLKTDAIKAKAIDPKNIDRIEILKDATATTLYGTNSGVIKITTKAAAKKEKSKIKF